MRCCVVGVFRNGAVWIYDAISAMDGNGQRTLEDGLPLLHSSPVGQGFQGGKAQKGVLIHPNEGGGEDKLADILSIEGFAFHVCQLPVEGQLGDKIATPKNVTHELGKVFGNIE